MSEITSGETLRSLHNGLRVLELLESSPGDLSLAEIARSLGLPPSSVSRLLRTLEAHGLVRREPCSRRYRLGLRVLEMAGSTIDRLGLHHVARQTLDRLVESTHESAHLVVADDARGWVCIEKVEGSNPTGVFTRVGARLPLHCTAGGKILLAYATSGLVATVLGGPLERYTASTIVDPDELRQQLALVREQGYALSPGEYFDGVDAVAAPIFDHRRAIRAAVGLAGAALRFGYDRQPLLIEATRSAAMDISHLLGFR